MAKSSRPVSKSREFESSWVLWVLLGRTRLRYCCRSMSEVGCPSISIRPEAPRLGRPSLPTGTVTRCLNFGSRKRSKRSGGSMMCMSESTNRRPSFIACSFLGGDDLAAEPRHDVPGEQLEAPARPGLVHHAEVDLKARVHLAERLADVGELLGHVLGIPDDRAGLAEHALVGDVVEHLLERR